MQAATSLLHILEDSLLDFVLLLTALICLLVTIKSKQGWGFAPATASIALLLIGSILRQVTHISQSSGLFFFIAFFVIPFTLLAASTVMVLYKQWPGMQQRGQA